MSGSRLECCYINEGFYMCGWQVSEPDCVLFTSSFTSPLSNTCQKNWSHTCLLAGNKARTFTVSRMIRRASHLSIHRLITQFRFYGKVIARNMNAKPTVSPCKKKKKKTRLSDFISSCRSLSLWQLYWIANSIGSVMKQLACDAQSSFLEEGGLSGCETSLPLAPLKHFCLFFFALFWTVLCVFFSILALLQHIL